MAATVRFEIFPADLDAMAAFYVSVLGFKIRSDRRDHDEPYLALERDGIKLGAAQRADVETQEVRRPPIGLELVLEVEDLEGERSRVADAGWPVAAEITSRPWGLIDFRVLDPDGYYWRITSRA